MLAAAGSGSNETRVFDAVTKEPLGVFLNPSPVYNVDFTHDANMLAAASSAPGNGVQILKTSNLGRGRSKVKPLSPVLLRKPKKTAILGMAVMLAAPAICTPLTPC